MTRNARWTEAEDDVLRAKYPGGGVSACAAELPHRSKDTIKWRAGWLHLYRAGPRLKPRSHRKPEPEPGPDAKTRACLRCREDFVSEWAGERVCPTCKNGGAWRRALQDALVDCGGPVRLGGRA